MSTENTKEEIKSENEELVEEPKEEISEEQSNELTEAQVDGDTQDSVEMDENQQMIERLEKELAEAKDSLLRKAAELENVRKRVQRERYSLFEEAKVAALEEFLPISEDMKRTLEASNGTEIEKNFLQGVQLVANKFEEVLNRYGVERIDETGVPFDVNLHDAMLRQPAPDKKTESDTVLQVLESGYKIGNKVIRHAKVIVSE